MLSSFSPPSLVPSPTWPCLPPPLSSNASRSFSLGPVVLVSQFSARGWINFHWFPKTRRMKIGWLTFRLPAPYYLAIIPGGQASAAALKDFGEQSGTSLTWTVDTSSGTSVSVKVTDSTGAINYSSPVTIRESVRSSAQSEADAYFRGWLQWLLCFYFYCRHRLDWVFYWVSIRFALNVRK